MTRPLPLTLHGQPVLLMAPELPQRDSLALGQAPLPLDVTLHRERPALPDTELETPPATQPGQAEQAERLVASIGRSLLEVLQGRRPASQLAMWMQSHAHHLLLVWCRHRSWQQVTLLATRASAVDDDVVEGTLLLERSGQVFAAPLRLERHHRRWQVATLALLEAPHHVATAA